MSLKNDSPPSTDGLSLQASSINKHSVSSTMDINPYPSKTDAPDEKLGVKEPSQQNLSAQASSVVK
jgi:hypothetical protein